MKKHWMAMTMATAVMLGGCGGDKFDDDRGVYRKSGNSLNVADKNDMYNPNQAHDGEQFGFVRQVKSPTDTGSNAEPVKWMNRETAANNISKMAVQLPNVTDCSVVVTDQEVLIAYTVDNDDEKARFETADQVKRTAMSAIPRWYHVYLTDDPALRQNVENIGSMNTTFTTKDESVKSVVNLMLNRSPQGRDMSIGENANGEGRGELNKHLDRSNYRQQWEANQ